MKLMLPRFDGHLETRTMGPREGVWMPGRRGYPPEFRAEAVELYHTSDKSIRDIAAELGISSESLRRWVAQHGIDAGKRKGPHHRRAGGAHQPPQGEPSPQDGAEILKKPRPSSPTRTGSGSGPLLHRAEKANFPVKVMCEVLGVSRSGFYQWETRAVASLLL